MMVRQLLIALFLSCILISLQAQESDGDKKIFEAGQRYVIHRVKAGETLYSIGRRYQVSLEEISKHNPQATGILKPGDVLKIPEKESALPEAVTPADQYDIHIILHKVQRKETLYFISRKYGATIDEILAYNPGLSKLRRGETIRIPQRITSDGVQVQRLPSAAGEGSGSVTHWVQPGETLYSISRRYGISVEALVEQNPHAAELKSGMRLTIARGGAKPDTSADKTTEYVNHTISAGETLYSLCRKYNITAEDLVRLNPVLEKSFKTGTVLRIPRVVETPERGSALSESNEIFHIVTSGETLYGLAGIYQVAVEDIERRNPFLSSRPPRIGDTLRILSPLTQVLVKDETEERAPATSECKGIHRDAGRSVRIAVLLPIMLESNRNLNAEFLSGRNSEHQDDSAKVTPKPEGYIRFQGSSENFIHFYEGVLLAVDSLRQMGIKAELDVFDTEQRSSKVKSLVSSGKLDRADLIIGPVFPNEQKEIADFAINRKIPVVSPLSGSDEISSRNPWFFQVNPSRDFIDAERAKYVVSAYKSSNILVLETGSSGNDAQKEKELIQGVLAKADTSHNASTVRMVNYRRDGYTGLRNAMMKERKNVVIIPSDNEAEVSVAVSNMKALSAAFDVTLIGSNRFPMFESINPEHFHYGRLEFLTPYWPDYQNNVTRSFVHKFRNYFKTEPNQFSMQGYDVTFFFGKALSDFGKDFRACIPHASEHLVQGSYHFSQRPPGGFINDGLLLILYTSDFQIVRKNKGIH